MKQNKVCRRSFVYFPFCKEEGRVYRKNSAHFKYQLFHSRWRGVGRENEYWGNIADWFWNNAGHSSITSMPMLNSQGFQHLTEQKISMIELNNLFNHLISYSLILPFTIKEDCWINMLSQTIVYTSASTIQWECRIV